jgi:alpha,alpha-trehalase
MWAHSRLICAAGLDRIAAAPGAPSGDAARWRALADRLLGFAGAHCVHPSGRWQRAADDERLDAALVLPGIRGATPADDPRHLATVEAVRRELAREGFVYRYHHRDQALHEAEGAFLLCGFWMCLADLQRGDVLRALRWFERGRTACGPPGLLSEEYDVRQRQLRGNLPQAFVHALLLECAARLAPHVGDEP